MPKKLLICLKMIDIWEHFKTKAILNTSRNMVLSDFLIDILIITNGVQESVWNCE